MPLIPALREAEAGRYLSSKQTWFTVQALGQEPHKETLSQKTEKLKTKDINNKDDVAHC